MDEDCRQYRDTIVGFTPLSSQGRVTKAWVDWGSGL